MANLTKLNVSEMKGAAHRACTLLKVLGNEKRLMILCHLANGESSVGEIGKALEFEQAPLSQHLARLRHHGLVEFRRDAQTLYYSLSNKEARRIINLLHEIYCSPDNKT